jgi:hypothetical protein
MKGGAACILCVAVRVAVCVRLGRVSGRRILQENLDLFARLCDAVHIVAVLVAASDIGGPREGGNGQDGKKDLHGDWTICDDKIRRKQQSKSVPCSAVYPGTNSCPI